MTTNSKKYDVVIIGSGLGSLLSARFLSMEGYKVCVLEKNRQFGGNLQTFARDKRIFDTGVHYLGGLDKGQNLYRIFNYAGIMDKLKLERMNLEAFDIVSFDGDPNQYKMAQGYERFENTLISYFPTEETAIKIFVKKVKEIGDHFSVYNIRPGTENSVETDFFNIGAKDYIASLTDNKALQGVLAGNSFLYAGRAEKTPLYVLAMSIDPYIKSSWRCIDGGSQIAKELIKLIKADGGEVLKYKEVKRFGFEGGDLIKYAETQDGERFEADQFISGIHPKQTLQMVEPGKIRKVYKKRIGRLKNTMGGFGVHLVFKENSFPYKKNNHYHFRSYDAWRGVDYEESNWPDSIVITFSASSRSPEWAETLTVMGYMKFEEVEQWANTFNTTSKQQDRGAEYEAFKKEKAELLLSEAEKVFPDIRSCIKSVYTSSPLSYRDYIGGDDGTMYGIERDYKNPLVSYLSPRTRVKNLLLTGQNLNLHGIMGVSISAIVTCTELLGPNYIINKINEQESKAAQVT